MVELCRDPLWNSTQSWDTSSPALSACLHSLLELDHQPGGEREEEGGGGSADGGGCRSGGDAGSG